MTADLRLTQTTAVTSPVDFFGYVGTLRDQTPRREILRFLQGLNLTHSVRDVRRDFANGYLVAQICQRHYPGDFQLHSFDNGLSMVRPREILPPMSTCSTLKCTFYDESKPNIIPNRSAGDTA